jgi:hypothetical protein
MNSDWPMRHVILTNSGIWLQLEAGYGNCKFSQLPNMVRHMLPSFLTYIFLVVLPMVRVCRPA